MQDKRWLQEIAAADAQISDCDSLYLQLQRQAASVPYQERKIVLREMRLVAVFRKEQLKRAKHAQKMHVFYNT